MFPGPWVTTSLGEGYSMSGCRSGFLINSQLDDPEAKLKS